VNHQAEQEQQHEERTGIEGIHPGQNHSKHRGEGRGVQWAEKRQIERGRAGRCRNVLSGARLVCRGPRDQFGMASLGLSRRLSDIMSTKKASADRSSIGRAAAPRRLSQDRQRVGRRRSAGLEERVTPTMLPSVHAVAIAQADQGISVRQLDKVGIDQTNHTVLR
jgi:hypothetical protein